MRSITIRDVAQRAGVSVGTVSNALNQPGIVAAETRRHIFKAIDETGYIRNSAARQLRGLRSPAIGLVVLDIDNPFFTDVARGVDAVASTVDHLLILCSSGGARSREDQQLRLLEEQRVTGVLMTPTGRRASAFHDKVRARGTPIVLLDRRSTRRDQCSVAVDDVEGGQLAARHLVELGHTRVAFINGPCGITQFKDRRAGFVAALADAGLTLSVTNDIEMSTVTPAITAAIADGEAAAKKVLLQRKPPTAIFCGNDLFALGAEHAILESGRRLPEDVALIGYDDVPFAALAFVPLTSVRQPSYELGHRGARLLLDEASGISHRHEHVTFTPELVVRESTCGTGPARRRVMG
jgi:LacI family transcriptional regulator